MKMEDVSALLRTPSSVSSTRSFALSRTSSSVYDGSITSSSSVKSSRSSSPSNAYIRPSRAALLQSLNLGAPHPVTYNGAGIGDGAGVVRPPSSHCGDSLASRSSSPHNSLARKGSDYSLPAVDSSLNLLPQFVAASAVATAPRKTTTPNILPRSPGSVAKSRVADPAAAYGSQVESVSLPRKPTNKAQHATVKRGIRDRLRNRLSGVLHSSR